MNILQENILIERARERERERERERGIYQQLLFTINMFWTQYINIKKIKIKIALL